MSRKGPVVVKGMLDFVEDFFEGVRSHSIHFGLHKLLQTSNELVAGTHE